MAIDNPYWLEPFRLIVNCKFQIGSRTFRFYPVTNVAGGSDDYKNYVNGGVFPISYYDLQGTPVHMDYYPENNDVWSGRTGGDRFLETEQGYLVWGPYQHFLNGADFVTNNPLLNPLSSDANRPHLYGFNGVCGIMTSPGGTQWLLTSINDGTLPAGVPASYPGGTPPSEYRYTAYRISDVPNGETLNDYYDLMDTWTINTPPAPFFYYTDGQETDYVKRNYDLKFSPDGSKFTGLQYWYYRDLDNGGTVETDWRYHDRSFTIANESSAPALFSETTGTVLSGGWYNNESTETYDEEYINGVYFENNILTFSKIKWVSGSSHNVINGYDLWGVYGGELSGITASTDYIYGLYHGNNLILQGYNNFNQVFVKECRKTTLWADQPWPDCEEYWYTYSWSYATTHDSKSYIIHANYPELKFLIYTELHYSRPSFSGTYTYTIGHYIYRNGVSTLLHEFSYQNTPGTSDSYQHPGPVPDKLVGASHFCASGDGSCVSGAQPDPFTDTHTLKDNMWLFMSRQGSILDAKLFFREMYRELNPEVNPPDEGYIKHYDIIHDTETDNIVVTINYKLLFKSFVQWIADYYIFRAIDNAGFTLTAEQLAVYDERFDTKKVSSSGTVTEFITEIAPGYSGSANTFGLRMWPSTYTLP